MAGFTSRRHILGQRQSNTGQPYTLNLGIKSGKGCTGSIGMGSKGSFKLIVIGKTLYFNPDDAFRKANAGSAADSVVEIKAPKDSSGTGGDLTFSTSAPITLTPPPASQVIAGSAVGVS